MTITKSTVTIFPQLIYLFFVSVISQFVIAIAYMPYFLFSLISMIQEGNYAEFNMYQQSFIIFIISVIVYMFFIFIFKKFTLDTRIFSEKLLIFLILLIMQILIHNLAFYNIFFQYFILFISALCLLQTSTILHARNNLISLQSLTLASMILSVIGGIVMVIRFFPFVWIGETIIKLTNYQFNIFWFDFGGFALIYFSFWTSILYFCFFYGLKLIKTREK